MKAIKEQFFSKSQYGLLFPLSLPNLAHGPLRAKSSGAVMQSADLKIILLAQFYSFFKQTLCEQLKLWKASSPWLSPVIDGLVSNLSFDLKLQALSQ